jgi:signal transduction histidine kinase/CHASE3 domain sensor protein
VRTQPVATTGLDAGRGAATIASPYGDDDDPDRHPGSYEPDPSRARRTAATIRNPSGWRVRTKLIAILAVPVVAILVFAGTGAATVLTSTRHINRINRLSDLSRQALQLTAQLEKERTFAVGYVASGPTRSLSSVQAQRQATDAVAKGFQRHLLSNLSSYTPAARAAVVSASDRLARLPDIRQASLTMNSPDSVRQSYTNLIDGLNSLISQIPQGNDDASLNGSVNAAAALAQAADLASQEQAQVFGLLHLNRFTAPDFREFLSLDTEKDNEITAFQAVATPAQAGAYQTASTDPDVAASNDFIQQVITSPTGTPLANIASDKWYESTQVGVNLSAQLAGNVLTQVDARVSTLRSKIQRQALIDGFLIIFILLAAIVTAVIVARSLVRPLLTLRTAALDIAGRRLPDAVRRLRDSTDQQIDTRIEPVGIDTDEEIGEVARAFDEVHREAVHLASEQAVLRNNVNAMFVNLSRRSQSLVERQLRLIDDLENREQDPDQLSNLFKLDHLATRMRRNNESLLVLAGTDTARRWSHPVPLNEVVLAAISEVEQYTRVKQTQAASVSIAGHAVSDVVHLIAELLENATAYSPPATDVVVTSHSLGPGAGAMIEIIDQGIGMPAKDLERVNERLANPPVVDVTVSRTMGLFAVGRLASRHGIRVQLREPESGGITALVRLPARVVTGEDQVDMPEPDNASSQSGRALPTGPERPAVGGPGLRKALPGNSGPLPLVGAGSNGHNGNHGAENGYANHSPAAELDDLSDLGEISSGGYFDTDGRSSHPDVRDAPTVIPRAFGARQPAEETFTGDRSFDDDTFTGGRGGPADRSFQPDDRSFQPDERSFQPDSGAFEDDQTLRDDRGDVDRAAGRSLFDPPARKTPASPDKSSPDSVPSSDNGGFARGRRVNTAGANGGVTGADRGIRDDRSTDSPFRREPMGGRRPGGALPAERGGADLVGPPTGELVVPAPAEPAAARSHEPADTGGDREPDPDTTPIFDSVSAWFQRRSPADRPLPRRDVGAGRPSVPSAGGRMLGGPSTYSQPDQRRGLTGGFGSRPSSPSHENRPAVPPQPAPVPAPVAAVEQTWSSSADDGWRAAEAAREPEAAGLTRSGLPIRVPKAHLVPGSAQPAPRRPAVDPSTRAPESVGGRLASFYQGVRQARDAGPDNDGLRDPRENM